MRDKELSRLEGLSVRMLDVRHGHGWEYLDQYALRIQVESSNLKNKKGVCGKHSTFLPLILQINGITHFKKCKQLFEYQHLLLLRDIWWSKL